MPLVSTQDLATAARRAAAEELRRTASALAVEAARLRDRAIEIERGG